MAINSAEDMLREAQALVPYFASRDIGVDHAIATLALFIHNERKAVGGQFSPEQAMSFGKMLNEAVFGKGTA